MLWPPDGAHAENMAMVTDAVARSVAREMAEALTAEDVAANLAVPETAAVAAAA